MGARSAATTPLPNVDELHRRFRYDEETGELLWRECPGAHRGWNGRHAGTPVGHPDHLGRRRVHINGIRVRVHRVIFKMVHGIEPGVIDHVNGNPADNRIENLRAATAQQNAQNGKARGSLLKGVSKKDSGYGAAIGNEGKTIWLGTYDTEAEAHAAYRGAAIAMFGEFARFE